VRTIDLYLGSDGQWSLRADSGGQLVRAELADGYVTGQGPMGSPRVLSNLPNELGMTIVQALERGILKLAKDGVSEFDRVTLVNLKSFPPPK